MPIISDRPVVNILLVGVACFAPALPAHGHAPRVEIEEMTHAADVIVVGTVTRTAVRTTPHGMIFTDVTLSDLDVVHLSREALAVDDTLTLSYAGGDNGQESLRICCAPDLRAGERYVLFATHAGRSYANPFVGGQQGIFRLVSDEHDDTLYPVSTGGHGIVAITDGRVETSGHVLSVRDGRAVTRTVESAMAPAPVSPEGSGNTAATRRSEQTCSILSVEAFAEAIRDIAAGPAPSTRVLRGMDRGDVTVTSDQHGPFVAPLVKSRHPADPEADGERAAFLAGMLAPATKDDAPARTAGARAPLCVCGSFDVFATMQQVPGSWWNWPLNNDVLWQFNQVMDVFRTSAHEPGYGYNNTFEFVGWLESETLDETYGTFWNGFLAFAFMRSTPGSPCDEILETDIVLNPAYQWTNDLDVSLGDPDFAHYTQVMLHEVGHAWGAQRGNCNEDYEYDRPTVMHAYYNNIIEDGEGIHGWDAATLRDNYDDQDSVPPRIDLGVESWYVNNGSINNTRSADDFGDYYYQGEPFTIENLTIENMSSGPVLDVRVRLYLSTNDVISTSDYRISGYWEWPVLSEGDWWTGNLSGFIPDDVPPGQYYVGAIITRGGSGYLGDEYPNNNSARLRTKFGVFEAPPANNHCADAATIQAGVFPFDTNTTTTDGPEQPGCSETGHAWNDIWYRYTAPCDGSLVVSTCGGADFDTHLMLYDDQGFCPPAAAALLDCSDDVELCGNESIVSTAVARGQHVLIRVGGHALEDEGHGELQVHFTPALANNDIGDAIPISDGATSFSTLCATTDGPELVLPPCRFQIHSDVWFTYTPVCTGTVTVTTCGLAGFDTALALYEGTGQLGISDGDRIGCNADGPQCTGGTALLTAHVEAGMPYLLRIGSETRRVDGTGSVHISCTPDCPDTNGDGLINFADLELLLDHWGEVVPPGTMGDTNFTGVVNFFDLNLLLDHWGEACD